METEKHFTDMTEKQQKAINERDLKELKEYYGSWDLLRDVINGLEWNENEAAYERHTSGGSDAWSGGFCANH